jgi:hypothetical protein
MGGLVSSSLLHMNGPSEGALVLLFEVSLIPSLSGILSRWFGTPPMQSDRVINIVTPVRESNSDRNLTYPFSADVTEERLCLMNRRLGNTCGL